MTFDIRTFFLKYFVLGYLKLNLSTHWSYGVNGRGSLVTGGGLAGNIEITTHANSFFLTFIEMNYVLQNSYALA